MFGGARVNSIGYAIADKLWNEDWNVAICDRPSVISNRAGKKTFNAIPCDLMFDEGIEYAVKKASEWAGNSLAGMIYAAGYNRIGGVAGYKRSDWETTLRLNLTAPFICMQQLMRLYPVPLYVPFNYIILGSNTSYIAKTRTAAYGASKAGVVHMAACMHRELAPLGYRVTVLNFGPVLDTDMDLITQEELREQRGWDHDEYLKQLTKNIPVKRFTKPQEIADVAWFILEHSVGELFGGRAVNFDGGQQQG